MLWRFLNISKKSLKGRNGISIAWRNIGQCGLHSKGVPS